MPFASENFRPLLELTLLLTVVVVALGAYVRLSDAGLGCPDWPGCYGQMWAPEALDERLASEFSGARAFDPVAARQEMAHRLLAGILGLLLAAVAGLGWYYRLCPAWLCAGLLATLLAQIVLGMLTVTWLLKPVVVTAHLFFGFAIAVLLWLMHACDRFRRPEGRSFVAVDARPARDTRAAPGPFSGVGAWIFIAVGILLLLQIFLGVWMSSHYASLACTGFPGCNGQWWPKMDFSQAFSLWQGLGVNYEYGVLDNAARIAIHWAHRFNAALLCLLAVPVMISACCRGGGAVRNSAALFLITLVLQIVLGVINVVAALPLANAVAHTVVALVLVLSWLELSMRLWPDSFGDFYDPARPPARPGADIRPGAMPEGRMGGTGR